MAGVRLQIHARKNTFFYQSLRKPKVDPRPVSCYKVKMHFTTLISVSPLNKKQKFTFILYFATERRAFRVKGVPSHRYMIRPKATDRRTEAQM